MTGPGRWRTEGIPPGPERARAQAHLMELLDPQTMAQHRTAIWLLDWDTPTLENLAAMIEAARG